MAIAKFDDSTPDNPKIVAAGAEAAWLWFCSVLWSRRALTDGFIPRPRVAMLYPGIKRPMKLAAHLVAVGLWIEEPNGFRIHDFHDWNPSKEQVEAYRARDRERKQRGHSTRSSTSDSMLDSNVDSRSESERNPNGFRYTRARHAGAKSVCVSESEGSTAALRAGDLDSGFAAFWERYPNRVDRASAEAVWRQLRPDQALVERIVRALAWQVRQPKWREEGGRYVPFASKWLACRRWEDEPPVRLRAVPAAGTDWREECEQLHGGRCSNVHFHLALLAEERAS